MTQMPYPPQQGYPAQQPQQYPPAQQPQQYPPAQPYPPQAYVQPGYPPQGYAPPMQPMQQGQAPAAPVVAGSMDDFYNQPATGGGPGISWKDKQIGTSYLGVIAGKCTVQQDSDYTTKQLKFQRDGVTPKWVMLIPLKNIQTNHPGAPEYPDGEAVFYVRGQAKDELTRAMAEAGCSGEPVEGATFQVTLTNRKPQRQGNPANIVQIVYGPPNGQPHQADPVQQAPVQQQEAPQVQAAIQPQAPVQQAPQGLAPLGQPQQAAPLAPLGQPAQQQVQQPVQQEAPAQLEPMGQQGAPPQWAQPAQAQQAPIQQGLAPQPPAGLAPEAQALLQQLGANQTAPQG